MVLLSIIAGVAFFLVLVLIAINLVARANRPDEPEPTPIIHASGIYSIVRRSPRVTIFEVRKTGEQIAKYLSDKNEDIQGEKISASDKKALAESWSVQLEQNIREVEAGDHQGVEFYYFDFLGDDPVCEGFVEKGHFVTREEIFRFPQVIPPFHIGCRCVLKAHHGSENLRETTLLGMRPFFRDENLPPLPSWSDVYKST